MRRFLLLAIVVMGLLGHSQPQDQMATGRIEGFVFDGNGSALQGALVEAVPQFSAFDGIRPRPVTTDASGHFSFPRPFPLGGAYKVYARKDADGYPDRSSKFYEDDAVIIPVAYLTEDHPFATVFVDLIEKAVVLTGSVVDAHTHAKVKARLAFYDDDGNAIDVSAGGSYRALLPAKKNLNLWVIAHGYRRYFRQPLWFKPGQQAYLQIALSKK